MVKLPHFIISTHMSVKVKELKITRFSPNGKSKNNSIKTKYKHMPAEQNRSYSANKSMQIK